MILDPRLADLVNDAVDGAASEKDAAELRAYLAVHPEAREELNQLKALSGVLGRVSPVEPPPLLKDAVLRGISASKHPRNHPKDPVLSRRVVRGPWLGGRSLLQYGSALAAGLLLGVALGHWGGFGTADQSGRIDPSVLVGTMTSRAATSPKPILEVPLESRQASGAVQVRRGEAGYLIDLDLSVSEPVRIELHYAPQMAAFRGFAQDIDAVQGLAVTEDTVTWSQSGRQRISVVMTPRTTGGTKVDLRVFSGNVAMGGRSLDLPPIEGSF